MKKYLFLILVSDLILVTNLFGQASATGQIIEEPKTYSLVRSYYKMDSVSLLLGTNEGLYFLKPNGPGQKLESQKLYGESVNAIYKLSECVFLALSNGKFLLLSYSLEKRIFNCRILDHTDALINCNTQGESVSAHYYVSGSKTYFIKGDEKNLRENSLMSEASFRDILEKIKVYGNFDELSSLEQLHAKDPSELIYFRYICDQFILSVYSKHGMIYYFNPEGMQGRQVHQEGFYAMHFLHADGSPKPVTYLKFSPGY